MVDRCRGGGRLRAQRWSFNGTTVLQAGSGFGLTACDDQHGGASTGCFSPPQVWLQQMPCDSPSSGSGGGGCAWSLDAVTGQLTTPAGDRCLAACHGNPYPGKPHTAFEVPTCHADSPSAALAFCDERLGFVARAKDLTARLTTVEKSVLWTVFGMGSPIPRLNLKHGKLFYSASSMGSYETFCFV